jgi:large subunit ribosomal protein L5
MTGIKDEENKTDNKSQKGKSNTNVMKNIYVDKVTINMGVGEGGEELDKATKIIKLITNKEPVKTMCKTKLPIWGIRPGIPIGCKLTLRGKEAMDFLKLTLRAKENRLPKKIFTDNGNFSFGIHEYLDLPGIKYDPSLGIRGFDVCVNLRRRGYRVKLRKYNKNKVGKNHIINKQEAIDFVRNKLKVVVE